MSIDIKACRQICDAAYEPDWVNRYGEVCVVRGGIPHRIGAFENPANARLAAHARTALPAALDEIERLRSVRRGPHPDFDRWWEAAKANLPVQGLKGKPLPKAIARAGWEAREAEIERLRAALEDGDRLIQYVLTYHPDIAAKSETGGEG